jgi:hypothetical protein
METQHTPTFAELAADPEIAALLTFEPAIVRTRVNGWDAEAQRALVALIAFTGSKLRAAKAIGRNAGSLDRIFDRPDGAAFFNASEAALALHRQRHGARLAEGVAHAAKRASGPHDEWAEPLPPLLPGQVYNEYGEPEDEASLRRRGEEAMDSIGNKLIRIRRLFLQEISSSPGKRAAFEILTDHDVDWEIAKTGDPQPDEPWLSTNQREPEMVLLAESGWSYGEVGYGPDRKAELRAAIDEARREQGLPPVQWDGESTERSAAD